MYSQFKDRIHFFKTVFYLLHCKSLTSTGLPQTISPYAIFETIPLEREIYEILIHVFDRIYGHGRNLGD